MCCGHPLHLAIPQTAAISWAPAVGCGELDAARCAAARWAADSCDVCSDPGAPMTGNFQESTPPPPELPPPPPERFPTSSALPHAACAERGEERDERRPGGGAATRRCVALRSGPARWRRRSARATARTRGPATRGLPRRSWASRAGPHLPPTRGVLLPAAERRWRRLLRGR